MRKLNYKRRITLSEPGVLTKKMAQEKLSVATPKQRIINENIKEIFLVANTIESEIARYLIEYFIAEEEGGKRDQFSREIVLTSSFSFNAKKVAYLRLLKETSTITGAEYAEFDKILSRFIKVRNALTHGHISYRDNDFIVEYHEGVKMTKVLDDSYWKEVDNYVKNCLLYTSPSPRDRG